MAIHRVAADGFGSAAEAYEAARPGYPAEVVDWLMAKLAIDPAAVLVDLAAGTGKLTRLLAERGARPIAVEPVAGMRALLHRTAPDIPAIAAVAEALPIRTGSVDAMTIAQAFHWFDSPATHEELGRVLRPGARIALLWNARDRTVDWVDAVWSIMDRVEKHAPWRDHDQARSSATWRIPGFSRFDGARFFHEHVSSPSMVVQRLASVSHVAVLPEVERRAVLDEVRHILDHHPDTTGRAEVSIRYRVECHVAERLPGGRSS